MFPGVSLRSGWSWLLLQFSRNILVRATFFALLSIAAALLAPLLEPPLPEGLAMRLGTETVRGILEVLASSMLVVATFSLGTLISAYAVASSSTTPRVTELLMQDTRVQNAIGIFVGAFLFALAGLIGLGAGLYREHGGILLFLVTIAVVVVVVAVFLRWVDLVSRVGRIPDAVDRTVRAARIALDDRLRRPWLGAAPYGKLEVRGRLGATRGAYLRHIDLAKLQELARDGEATFRLEVLPGDFVGPDTTLMVADVELDADLTRQILGAFDLGPRRTFDLDPRYGVITLAEIGCKALSPGINDPGTAISVIAALTAVLGDSTSADVHAEAPEFDRVQARAIAEEDMIEDAFGALARAGAGHFQVLVRLQKALAHLAEGRQMALASAARAMSATVAELAEASLTLAADRERIRALATSGPER
jgi:uncharacterized membrane protein